MSDTNWSTRMPEVGLFFAAVGWNNVEEVENLLRDHPDLIFSRSPRGETPLHVAASWGHKETVESLLIRGAEVNAKSESEETALHFAAEEGDLEVITCLLDHGAEINCRNMNGQTPLHWAAQHGHKDAVALLLSKGAQVNAKDNLGQTPLHISARWEPEVPACLRRHGGHDLPLPISAPCR